MTATLALPTKSEMTSSSDTNPLCCSSSQTLNMPQIPTTYSRSFTNAKLRLALVKNDTTPTSFRSPASLSSRLAILQSLNQPFHISSQSSSSSLDEPSGDDDDDEEEEDIRFRSRYLEDVDNMGPPFGPASTEVDAVTASASNILPDTVSYSNTADHLSTTRDDTGVREEPTTLIDYLSYKWKEEEIWHSWRHIVMERESTSNSRRLENASWRSWTKSRDQLKTIPAEALNWMKDHDVTWLYGPLLKTSCCKPVYSKNCVATKQNSSDNSLDSKKPILKKPSLSETMLRRSVSSSTLMRQATDSLCAQQRENQTHSQPFLDNRAYSDSLGSSYLGSITSQSATSPPSDWLSVSTSGGGSRVMRHIRFNNEVEQCIAISGGSYDGDHQDTADDETLEVKPILRERSLRSSYSPPQNSSSGARIFVAKLPSTTLNYREDTPESIEQTKQDGEAWNMELVYPPASSQEVIPKSTPSPNFFLVDEDEDADMKWQPPAFPDQRDQRDHRIPFQIHVGGSSDDLGDITEGRDISHVSPNIIIPDEDEDEVDDTAGHSLFRQAIETVNAARDIAFVIWNVGWVTS